MPRYTKTTKRFERFFEIFYDGTSVVYTAKGQRAAGTSDDWTIKDRDLRANLFAENPEAAKPFYDKSIAKMLKDAFELSGDEVPIITPFREEHVTSSNRINARLDAFEQEYGLVAKLRAGEKVYLVGGKPSNRDEFYEFSV
ncbi:MAG: hypothetical protein JRH20_27945, partial [Deltaproteobacteria bacterium]|nr:hypothetical protein [Deltaproteobacteria bacterium]